MIKFETVNGPIHLNLTNDHWLGTTGRTPSGKMTEVIERIFSVARKKEVPQHVFVGLDYLIWDTTVCFSPYAIFNRAAPLHRDICAYIVDNHEMTAGLYPELEAVGAFKFLEDVHDRRYSAGIANRFLSVFAVCAVGNVDFSTAPKEFIHAVVDWFRSDDGSAWNSDILGSSEAARQSVREMVKGLAYIYKYDDLLLKSRVYRQSWKKELTKNGLLKSDNPLHVEFKKLLEEFSQESRTSPSTINDCVPKIIQYFEETMPGLSVREILRLKTRPMLFSHYLTPDLKNVSDETVKKVNTARRILENFRAQVAEEDPAILHYEIISEREVDRIANRVPKKLADHSSARARALPPKMHLTTIEILSEGEAGWPGQCSAFYETVVINGRKTRIYCPAIPTILLTALHIPLRVGQIRRLDSGEGDLERYDPYTRQWDKNTGPLAGYWAKVNQTSDSKTLSRGYASRFYTEESDFAGFYINTNKTGAPWHMPWDHEEVHKLLYEMRCWQENNNPINRPLAPQHYVDNVNKISLTTLAEFPDIFALFRLFPTASKPFEGRIPSASMINKAWHIVMLELERRWNLANPQKQVTIVVGFQDKTGQPQRSIYTPHGMRKAGLTALGQTNVPVQLISSKVAGHAGISMTIFYQDPQPFWINDKLKESAAQVHAARELMDDFLHMDFEEAKRKTVSLDEMSHREAVAGTTAVEICNLGFGMCPWDCSRCEDGGPLKYIEKKGTHEVKHYGEVPGGRKNCILCRHFISGPPWLDPLSMLGDKYLERRSYIVGKEEELNSRTTKLEASLASGSIDQVEFYNRLDDSSRVLLDLREELEVVDTSILNVEIILRACVLLIEQHDSLTAGESSRRGVPLVAASRESVIQYFESTKLQQTFNLAAAGEIYPVLAEDRILQTRNLILDKISANSGEFPLTSLLLIGKITEAQLEKAHREYARFMMKRVSLQNIQKLADGDTKLQDLDIDRELRDVVRGVIGDDGFRIIPSKMLNELSQSQGIGL